MPALCAGLEPQGNTVLQPARFTVETQEAGSGEVLVYIQDPEGHTEEVWGAPWGLRGHCGVIVGSLRGHCGSCWVLSGHSGL